jgi:integrase
MEKMPATHHLVKRNGVWYYRRRVPLKLVAAVGSSVIQLTLGTKDLKDAQKKREILDLEWSAQFELLPASPSPVNGTSLTKEPITGQAAKKLIRDYVEKSVATFARRYEDSPPADAVERQDMAKQIDIDATILASVGDPQNDELVAVSLDRVLRGHSVDPSIEPELASFHRRALLEIQRRKLDTLHSRFDRPYVDTLFAPDQKPELSFGELADQYLTERLEDAELNGLGQKTIDKIRSNLALIRELVGNGTSVREIGYDACRRIRSTLAQIPANRHKIFPGLSLEKAIARAKSSSKPVLSPTTQSQYLDSLRAVLELAVLKEVIPTNFAKDLKPLKRDPVRAEDKRNPFTLEQIAVFFKSDFYQCCAAGTYSKPDRDWRFWLPLLCLFMGMRPREVCQLAVFDVKLTKKGVRFLDVVETQEDEDEPDSNMVKSVKTTTSRRKIPVHPQLEKIGLLEFIEARRKSGSKLLFPTLKPNIYGDPAQYALKRFREEFLPKEMPDLGERQVFYSFRHSFRDALRRAHAPPEALALGGWSQGKNVGDNYGGEQKNPDYLVEFVKGVQFPGLDLSHLAQVKWS